MRGLRGRFRSDVIADVISAGAVALVEAQASGLEGAKLLRFVQHACRRATRREMSWDNRRVSLEDLEASSVTAPDYSALWEAVNALPPRQQRAVVMRFWEGMSNAEVAEEMGVSEMAVRQMVKRAYESIRKYLLPSDTFCPSRCVHT